MAIIIFFQIWSMLTLDQTNNSFGVMNDSTKNGSNTQRGKKQSKNRSSGNGGRRGDENKSNAKKKSKSRGRSNNGKSKADNIVYPPYWSLDSCLKLYNAKDPNVVSSNDVFFVKIFLQIIFLTFFVFFFFFKIRGTLRVLPQKDAMGFCTCDRGSQKIDVVLEGPLERNRALDGDTVFVELIEEDEEEEQEETAKDDKQGEEDTDEAHVNDLEDESFWQDSPVQMSLWAPVVPIQRKLGVSISTSTTEEKKGQRKGRVVHVVPPKAFSSEINPTKQTKASCRKIVGTLKRLQSGTTLLTCSNKSLPQFRLSNEDAKKFKNSSVDTIFQAKYTYGSWEENYHWPPCTDVVQFGISCNIEDETAALLIENQVDHGEFPANVLEECQNVVSSGEYSNGTESGWRPTAEMYKGRRDYRKRRIFTIDPSTAKDLDDALHVEDLGNGQVEIGVHIADVSFFVESGSKLDDEATRRCTTVYLVDRTVREVVIMTKTIPFSNYSTCITHRSFCNPNTKTDSNATKASLRNCL